MRGVTYIGDGKPVGLRYEDAAELRPFKFSIALRSIFGTLVDAFSAIKAFVNVDELN